MKALKILLSLICIISIFSFNSVESHSPQNNNILQTLNNPPDSVVYAEKIGNRWKRINITVDDDVIKWAAVNLKDSFPDVETKIKKIRFNKKNLTLQLRKNFSCIAIVPLTERANSTAVLTLNTQGMPCP